MNNWQWGIDTNKLADDLITSCLHIDDVHDDIYIQNLLHIAARENNIPVIKRLLDNGADINFVGSMFTPVMYAATEGQKEATEYLLSRGAQTEHPYDGWSILVLVDNIDIVDIILKYNPDLDAEDRGLKILDDFRIPKYIRNHIKNNLPNK